MDDSSLGMDKLPGVPPVDEMARPMMLLNVLTEFCGSDTLLRKRYREDIDWAVTQILKHVSSSSVDALVCLINSKGRTDTMILYETCSLLTPNTGARL